jgi:hypothetical protein
MTTMTPVEGQASVALEDPSVADPSPEQDTPAPNDEADRWRAKAAEANKHAKAAAAKAKAEEQRAVEALQKLADIEAQHLAGQGEFKPLWEDAKKSNHQLQAKITELEHQLELERTSTQTERLRASAISRISDAGARKPDQLLKLLDLVDYEGAPAVIKGGVEVPLDQYLATLKQPGSDWEHHFLPTAKKGMGTPTASPGGAPAPGDPQPNPYLPGGNMTYRIMLEATQPELAAAMRSEAGMG